MINLILLICSCTSNEYMLQYLLTRGANVSDSTQTDIAVPT